MNLEKSIFDFCFIESIHNLIQCICYEGAWFTRLARFFDVGMIASVADQKM